MQQHKVGVEHHGASALVGEHVGGVLGDACADEVELAALRPELSEVVDDRGMPEQRLHLVDVEPGGDPSVDVGEVVVLKHRAKRADREDAAIGLVHTEDVRSPLRLEVDERGGYEVLRARARLRAHLVPGEREGGLRAQLRLQCGKALAPVERVRLAADAGERVDHVALDAGELRHGVVHVVRAHHVGEVAVAREVRYALAHLVVQDPVVLLGVEGRVIALGREEALASDLLLGDGDVGDGELHARVGPEVVVERREHGEDVLLALAPGRLVADVGELDGLGEEACLHLGDAVLVDGVVADVGGDVSRLGALLLLGLYLLLVLLLRSVGVGGLSEEQPEGALPLARSLGLSQAVLSMAHGPPLLCAWPVSWPVSSVCPSKVPSRPGRRDSCRGASGL